MRVGRCRWGGNKLVCGGGGGGIGEGWKEKKQEETESVHRKQTNEKVTKIRTWTTEIHETSIIIFFKQFAWFARGRAGEGGKENAKKRNKQTYAYHLSPQQLARL